MELGCAEQAHDEVSGGAFEERGDEIVRKRGAGAIATDGGGVADASFGVAALEPAALLEPINEVEDRGPGDGAGFGDRVPDVRDRGAVRAGVPDDVEDLVLNRG